MQQPIGAEFRADFHGSARAKQLQKLGADSFAREAGKALPLTDSRRTSGGIERAFAEIGRKAKEAQDAQIVLLDAPRGLADETHFSRRDVGKAAGVIEEPSIACHRKRVHCKIAAQGIRLEITAEANGRMTAIGFYVLTQGCHFKSLFPRKQGYGAMLKAGRNGANARRFRPRHDRLRQKRGRQIDLAGCPAEERIAQGAADNAGFLACMIQRGQNGAQGLIAEQGRKRIGRRDAPVFRRAHCKRPGTSRPFSIWAGM
ncbi:MAG: hypothetical protein USCAAHI_02475 [Beijerinckiaceae bacterium]|nr:MAG: hypothetical protein USCAAHI_02475 [Beijerinckiaceae bacterium]